MILFKYSIKYSFQEDIMILYRIKQKLEKNADEKYRDFSLTLTNNSALPMIGVRLPVLRSMAKDICRSKNQYEFLDQCDFSSIEISLLYGYVLGNIKDDIDVCLEYFKKGAAHVDNWCTCDTLSQSFKQAKKYRTEVWQQLLEFICSGKTYYMRIAVVTMMSHFMTDEYIDRILSIVSDAKNDDYYYKMGAAWTVATAMAKYRDKTFEFLKTCNLDNWTYNKAIQKMTESLRVSEKDKKILLKMKRK